MSHELVREGKLTYRKLLQGLILANDPKVSQALVGSAVAAILAELGVDLDTRLPDFDALYSIKKGVSQ